MPEHVDWFLWRVVHSEYVKCTLNEIVTSWTILDVLDAHCVIDHFETLEMKARWEQEQQSKAAKRANRTT